MSREAVDLPMAPKLGPPRYDLRKLQVDDSDPDLKKEKEARSTRELGPVLSLLKGRTTALIGRPPSKWSSRRIQETLDHLSIGTRVHIPLSRKQPGAIALYAQGVTAKKLAEARILGYTLIPYSLAIAEIEILSS